VRPPSRRRTAGGGRRNGPAGPGGAKRVKASRARPTGRYSPASIALLARRLRVGIPVMWPPADVPGCVTFPPPASPSARARSRRRTTGGGRGDGRRGSGRREARYATQPGHPELIPRRKPRHGRAGSAPASLRALPLLSHPHPHARGRGDGPRAKGGGTGRGASGA
jgi:hypothetical protein